MANNNLYNYYLYVAFALLCFSLITPSHNCLAVAASDKRHVALFVFGDSIFDPGNNNYINTTIDFQANFPPYGETYFKKRPTGRFSDGRLIQDFIAEFGKLPLIPAYFEREKNGVLNGVNFASGGAGSLVQTHTGFVIDLKTQMGYFKKVIKEIKWEMGDQDANNLLSNAVYMFSVGGNDYIAPSSIFNTSTQEEYVGMVIGNLTNALKEIYMEGGRKFVISSITSLGCLPYSRALNLQENKQRGCFKKFEILPHIHNKALPNELNKLEKSLHGFKYSYFDFFKAATNIIDHPSKYGFKEAKTGCCGSGPYNGLYSCGREKEYELCKDVGEFMFFDSYHPNEKANYIFATLLWNGAPNVVMNYSVKSLFELV